MKYRQCFLVKIGQLLQQTAWIPESFAHVGMKLRLRERGGEWDDGWTVDRAGELQEDPPDYREIFVACPEFRKGKDRP